MFGFKSIIVTAILAAGSVSAASVTDVIGDRDGFGIGIAEDAGFSYSAVGSAETQGTDGWQYGDQSVTHTYSAPVRAVTSASLEIFHGGAGFNGLGEVFFDGVSLGFMSDGDGIGPLGNYAKRDVFDLSAVLGLIDGSDLISFDMPSGDGWVLDYSALTFSTSDSFGSKPVPLPAGLPLLAGALSILALRRRRKAA